MSDVREAFDELVSAFDFPMFVVTTAAADDGERSGCLVGFTTQTSIDPPRYLVCLSVANHTAQVARRAELLALHLVPRDRFEISELFGEQTGDEVDKFARCSWRAGPDGVPLLDDCPTRLVGRILERLPAGDHLAHLLRPEAVDLAGGGPADHLTFRDVKGMPPGHAP